MVGWHHRLDGREFEQALGVGDGQGSLACCSLWGCKESDMTERLNWTELLWYVAASQAPFVFDEFGSVEKYLSVCNVPQIGFIKFFPHN